MFLPCTGAKAIFPSCWLRRAQEGEGKRQWEDQYLLRWFHVSVVSSQCTSSYFAFIKALPRRSSLHPPIHRRGNEAPGNDALTKVTPVVSYKVGIRLQIRLMPKFSFCCPALQRVNKAKSWSAAPGALTTVEASPYAVRAPRLYQDLRACGVEWGAQRAKQRSMRFVYIW